MRYRYVGRTKFRVVLRRSRGRYVKERDAPSMYAAKQIAKQWDAKYDHTYEIEIVPTEVIEVVK